MFVVKKRRSLRRRLGHQEKPVDAGPTVVSRHDPISTPRARPVSLSVGLLAAAPARAASLQKVNQSEWWAGVSGLPSYVNMYIYVPDKLAAKPPIVVAPHHCQGTGTGTYSEMSSLVSIANKNGFIMIFPEATGQNCWDAGSARSLKHGGGGDTRRHRADGEVHARQVQRRRGPRVLGGRLVGRDHDRGVARRVPRRLHGRRVVDGRSLRLLGAGLQRRHREREHRPVERRLRRRQRR